MATVTTATELIDAIANMDSDIIVANDITLTDPVLIQYTLKITGESGTSLFWNPASFTQRTMFTISGADYSLTIENITLDAEGRNGTLVHINSGTFVMEDGSVLKGVSGTSGGRPIEIAEPSSTAGGTFIMNGGLITENDCFECIECYGGKIFMNNNASISNNNAAAITASASFLNPDLRSAVTMAGNSSISNNLARQSGGAGIIFQSDLIMGVNEGDAPIVYENQTPYYCGSWFFYEATFAMDFDSEISDNYAPEFGGGIVSSRSAIHLKGNAKIINNKSGEEVGGILATDNSSVTIEDRAIISGNTASSIAGGILSQESSTIEIKGSAKICDNTATSGAGIYISDATCIVGSDGSSPEIFNNTAQENGGGVFIAPETRLELMGKAFIHDNSAAKGAGIYKEGQLYISRSAVISDGLFFDYLSGGRSFTLQEPLRAYVPVKVGGRELEHITGVHRRVYEPTALAEEAYIGNVPTIVDIFTSAAKIQLEASSYVSPENVPVCIAEKGSDYELLSETDRSAWLIPASFAPGHQVVLNDESDRVLIALETYNISYYHMYGVDNPNPQTYDISCEFPIFLMEPGKREGYVFNGWMDAEGNIVTEIPQGSAENLVLIATWIEEKHLCLKFDGNAPCVCHVPSPVHIVNGHQAIIPYQIPQKPRHCFVEWNTSPTGGGTAYAPGDVITAFNDSLTLFAMWLPLCERVNRPYEQGYCPRRKRC